MPHLYWQFTHGLPSVQYHLFERNASEYRISYTMEYLMGQIALDWSADGLAIALGGTAVQTGFPTGTRHEILTGRDIRFFPDDDFQRKSGSQLDFAFFIPLMVLSHQYLNNGGYAQQKWLYKSVPLTLGLILLVRIYLLSFVPASGWFHKADEVHGNKTWVSAVEERAAGLPVVFHQFLSACIQILVLCTATYLFAERRGLSPEQLQFLAGGRFHDGKKVMAIARTHPFLNDSFRCSYSAHRLPDKLCFRKILCLQPCDADQYSQSLLCKTACLYRKLQHFIAGTLPAGIQAVIDRTGFFCCKLYCRQEIAQFIYPFLFP